MITCDMTIQERKQAIKALFKGYRRMVSFYGKRTRVTRYSG